MRRRRLLQCTLAGAAAPWALRAHAAAGRMPLHLLRTGDIGGLPWIELAVGGAPTRWLLDTGATIALLSPALAARLQLAKRMSVPVITAGGTQWLERYTMPALPGFGATGPQGSTAVALDLSQMLGPAGGELDGVLGAPWFRDQLTTFDFARGELRWGGAPGGGSVLPLHWDRGLPTVRFALGARAPEAFLFDTGNAGALVVFAQRAEKLLAEAGSLPETTVRELGGSVSARFARLERFAAPGLALRELPAALESGERARRGGHFDRLAGAVGVALFEAGAVTVDGPGERLVVDLPGLPEPPPLPGGFGFRLDTGSAGELSIGAVIDGGPAALAGVAAGDRVLAFDAADVRRWTPAIAWAALVGREQVRLSLRRGEAAAQPLLLKRARFFPLLR